MKENPGKKYLTIEQTKAIVRFLNERREILNINGIERVSGIAISTIWQVITNNQKTFSKKTIVKLTPTLQKLGFEPIIFDYSIIEIQKRISKIYNIPLYIITNYTNQERSTIEPRQIAMWLCKRLVHTTPPISLRLIGKEFGINGHSNVFHSIKVVNNLIETDPKFKEKIDNILKEFPVIKI